MHGPSLCRRDREVGELADQQQRQVPGCVHRLPAALGLQGPGKQGGRGARNPPLACSLEVFVFTWVTSVRVVDVHMLLPTVASVASSSVT